MTPDGIRSRRLSHALDERAFADLVGVSRNAVRSWEHGRRTPTLRHQRAIEAVFSRLDGCVCSCHGRGVPSHAPSVWTDAEIADLRRLVAGGVSPDAIAADLSQTYGTRRTRRAVVDRAGRLGLTFYLNEHSARDAAHLLGVSRRRIDHWIHSGQLPATRHASIEDGRPTRWWRIEAADLKAFAALRRPTDA